MPCCVDAGIPEVCTGLCKGEFNIKTDTIKITSTCKDYVSPTLSCIATGIGRKIFPLEIHYASEELSKKCSNIFNFKPERKYFLPIIIILWQRWKIFQVTRWCIQKKFFPSINIFKKKNEKNLPPEMPQLENCYFLCERK